MRERIGYIRELVRHRIGRIYPKNEVVKHGHKAKAEAGEGG